MVSATYVQELEEFFRDNYINGLEKLSELWPDKNSIEVDYTLLERHSPEIADDLIENPDTIIKASEEAIASLGLVNTEGDLVAPKVRFFNLPSDLFIRNINSKHINKFLSIKGTINKITDVRPKVEVAIFECMHDGRRITVDQRSELFGKLNEPSRCPQCERNSFKLLVDECNFTDMQKMQVQEPLEALVRGEQAKNIDIWMEGDLTNKLFPGDTVEITGILRLIPPKHKSAIYSIYIHAIHVQQVEKKFEDIDLTEEEEEEIRELARDPDIYKKIVGSIAPSIYGHNEIKEALALQLFGGTRSKILPDGVKIRPDIHILLIGDPGCLIADERVVLGNGAIVKMGDMGTKHLEEINQQVLTGQGYKRDLATVFHSYRNQAIMEIITESGKSVKGTYNHPLLTVRNRKREWKKLEEMRVGDRVATVGRIPCTITAPVKTNWEKQKRTFGPRPKSQLPTRLDAPLAGLMGYVLGDGWVRKHRVCFLVAPEERDILPELTSIVEDSFGIKPSVRKLKPKAGRTAVLTEVDVNDADVANSLSFLKEKRVPDLIMKSGNAVAAEFLAWLFEADGCVFCKGRGKRAIQLKSASIELLRDVQILLLRFGVHSRINERNLYIRRAESIESFSGAVGFRSKKKKSRLKGLVEECKTLDHRRGKQRSEKVVEVREAGYADVFDIEVPAGHRFIANGIVSHNTAKSQLLYYIYTLAPKGVFVGGKSATGAGLCVAPDSLITLNDSGMCGIGDFIESQEFDAKEEAPDAFSSPHEAKVLSLDKELKTAYNTSTKIWKIKAPKKLVRITTTNGKELTLTPNTPLLTLTPNGVAWKKSSELNEEDYIATSRKTPRLKGKEIPTVSLIENRHVKIGNNASQLVSRITDRLAEKHGSIEKVAKIYGLKRDRLYRWRSEKWYQAADLQTIKKMALDAGMEYSEIAKEITTLFNRYGKNVRIEPFLTEELACLAGFIAGDGDIYRSNGHAIIRFHNSNEALLRKASRCFETAFGTKPVLINDGKRVANIRVNSMVIAEVLEKLGVPSGKKSAKITVPSYLNSSGYLAPYLQALFDCDGYVSQRKTRGSSVVGYTTTSKRLARSLQLLIEQWGITSRIRTRDKRDYEGKIRSRLVQYELVVSGRENLVLFEEHVGFSLKEKKKKLRTIINKTTKNDTNKDVIPGVSGLLMKIKKNCRLTEKQLPIAYCKGERKPSRRFVKKITKLLPDSKEKQFLDMLAESSIFWDKINEKEVFINKKLEWVYDFTIPKSHAFLANGVFVHNTATAEKDEFGEGGWTLKAGALVLASGGHACIDEFDKMGDEDRSSMHEAMEQQRISIAKAGIVTTFRSETSILAAANPKYGRFDPFTSPAEQFNIPPTLISRFDLIFPIKDVLDEARDKAMAKHILSAQQAAGIRGMAIDGVISKEELEEVEKRITPVLEQDLLRKYIAYARKTINPVLTTEAMDKIEQYYVELRGLGKSQGSVAVTARQLEALVRLAESSARGRLSIKVDIEDAERAIRLHQFVMQEIGVDKETGRFDIDIIATGQSKSKMDKVRSLYSIIKKLTAEYDVVTKDMIVEEAKLGGIEPKDVDSLMAILKKNGDVYSPKHGQFKTAEDR